jgi:hypothetical protein
MSKLQSVGKEFKPIVVCLYINFIEIPSRLRMVLHLAGYPVAMQTINFLGENSGVANR